MKIILFALILLLAPGCQDFWTEIRAALPPDIPVAQLLQAPDTITVDGMQLFLATELWRDFMPISPPDGKPLIAIAWIITTDSSQIPATVSADAIWVVNGSQVWRTYFSDEPGIAGPAYRLERIARNGPKWGPHVYVDVIVRVYGSDGNGRLLRASKQWIGRTD
ncbi:MAG: hypothetical protein AB1428_15055 [Bacteroidota bacterium]